MEQNVYYVPNPYQPQYVPAASYAGFWKRVAANLIDGIITGIIIIDFFIALIFFVMFMDDPEAMYSAMSAIYFWSIVISWLYYALLESSERQATIGKMALGIVVTDLNGQRISFGRATGRYFATIISALILFIGVLMAGFTPKKQALHDMMAGTLVVNK